MRKPNRSTAVMQRRKPGTNEALDDFPTPPWAARALMEHVIPGDHSRETVWEPTANRGYMALALGAYFNNVLCTDIHHYEGDRVPGGMDWWHTPVDFLLPEVRAHVLGGYAQMPGGRRPDWIITNPPFRLAAEFAAASLSYGDTIKGVALLVRTTWLEGVKRYDELFSVHPPSVIAQFTERVAMVEGRYDPKASSATSYLLLGGVGNLRPQSAADIHVDPAVSQAAREANRCRRQGMTEVSRDFVRCTVPCPKCKAEIGEPCKHHGKGAQKKIRLGSNHHERQQDAHKWMKRRRA